MNPSDPNPLTPPPVTAATAPSADGQRCGLVAIVGKPNVGKSTLLNALVGQKISITSRKAQTTRHRITGIRTVGPTQFIFVDTPGFQTRHAKALNKSLNKTVMGAIGDAYGMPAAMRSQAIVAMVTIGVAFLLPNERRMGELVRRAPRVAPAT